MLNACLVLLVATLLHSRVLREERGNMPHHDDEVTKTEARIVAPHTPGKREPSVRNQVVASVSPGGDVKTNVGRAATEAGSSEGGINSADHVAEAGIWSNWEQCSTTCGPGERRRICDFGDCKGRSTKPCSDNPPCPSDGEWGAWTACGVTCGTGVQHRQCARMPKHGGKECEGPEVRECIELPCKVDGVWGEWTQCGVSCGTGLRTRECEKMPEHGGKPCEGLKAESCEQPLCKECDTNAQCTDISKSLCDRNNLCAPCIENINCFHIAENMECTAGRCSVSYGKKAENADEKGFEIQWFHLAGGGGVLILLAGIGIFCAYRSGRTSGLVAGRKAAESSESDDDPDLPARTGKKK